MNKKYNAEDWKDRIIEAINSTNNMTEAYKFLGLERKTFKKMAEELNLYKPNQGNQGGIRKSIKRVSTEDILNNKAPFQSHKLKERLFEEGYKEKRCENCGLTKWLNKDIPLQLHHINGNHNDNSLNNLQILCPNCHALTDNYTSKNKKINSYNVTKKPTSKTGFLGVIYGKKNNKVLCRAVITHPKSKKRLQLGYTYEINNKDELIKLAKLYDEKAIELYGNNVTTNKSLNLY